MEKTGISWNDPRIISPEDTEVIWTKFSDRTCFFVDIANLSTLGLIFISMTWRDNSEDNVLLLEPHVIVQEMNIYPMLVP